MNMYVDNKLIRKLLSAIDIEDRDSLLNECIKIIEIPEEGSLDFVLDWSSLLEYLGFGSLFQTLPVLNKDNKIFASVIEVLKLDSEKEVIVYLYDQIFVECLTQVKGLQQILPNILLQQIRHMQANPLFSCAKDPFSSSLKMFEKKLAGKPEDTIHDLVLYLAWDRVCVYLAAIFDETSLEIRNGLNILKECLIESFQHITKQGRSKPGFFRLLEALYAYQMKQENLDNYTETEWQILCESVATLQSREFLADACYIKVKFTGNDYPLLKVLTIEPSERASARISFADYMNRKLKSEVSGWDFDLQPYEIMCLKNLESSLSVDSIINIK
ncbi:MAG TPA: hypothetical protein VGP47_06085 [Parachlamydiaceae bacterium]|nr:hypothetical protein [Parachlamydiaceae bacterium]